MKNILTIVKKELLRVFKDPKLIFVVLLLPGLMIFGLYSIMGSVMNNVGNDTTPLKIYTVNMPVSGEMGALLRSEGINADYTSITSDKVNENKEKLENNEIDMILVFSGTGDLPDVTIYYNPSDTKSAGGYQLINAALDTLQPNLKNFEVAINQVVNQKSATGQIFAMLVPFVLISLLFSGCMSVAPDSIAGEKERGTMATLLKTPVKRREIAIGKISALSILAIINAISSFIGLILSMPKLMPDVGNIWDVYNAGHFALILLIIISTVLVIISCMSIISSFARTVKEANMLIMPFMLLSMVVGVTSLIGSGAATQFYIYLIPLYNSVQSITAVLTNSINVVNLIITTVSNIAYAGIMIFVLTKLFNREKIMFAK